jgi:hypothetical protein
LGGKPLGNATDGIFLDGAPGNTVGGSGSGRGNLISANGSAGVQVFGSGASGNVLQGNMIGTDLSGAPRLGNKIGVFLNRASGTVLGGSGSAANLVGANSFGGVFTDSGSEGPTVSSVIETNAGTTITAIVLTFDADMDPSRAGNPANFRLQTLGRRQRFNITVPLQSAIYDPLARTVTLNLVIPVALGTPLRLTVSGSPRGLTDSAGIRLDGNFDGRPGGDFVTILGGQTTARRAALSTASPRTVHMSASHSAVRRHGR